MATELAAPAELATYRGGDPDLVVAAAEGAVRSYCGWHIAPARTETVTAMSDGGGALVLPTMQVRDVTAVRQLTTDGPVVDDAWRATPRLAAGVLLRTSDCWKYGGIYEVDCTHGYADVPPEVRAVVLDIANLLATAPGGVTRQVAGPFQTEVAEQNLTPLHRMVLNFYRLPGAT